MGHHVSAQSRPWGYFYLYLVVDIWGRRIVGWAIYDVESGELAADLVERICADNPRRDSILWLHSDNGAAMKSVPLLAKLKALGISPSFSRPRVSNDNPYSEALFRTLKYRPTFPSRPFADIHAAIAWVARFVEWALRLKFRALGLSPGFSSRGGRARRESWTNSGL